MIDNKVYDGEIKTMKDFDRLIDSLDPTKSDHQLSPKAIKDLDELMGSMTEDVKLPYESGVRVIPEGVSPMTLVYGSSKQLAEELQGNYNSGIDMESYGTF
jgi:hypothetical protein